MTEMSARRGFGAASGPEFESYHGLKRRIAVLQFEDDTDLGAGKAGSAATDMIISVLARSGRFVIVERSELETILQEQTLGQSGAMTFESAISAGRLSGVQALVLGRVESLQYEYSRKDLDSDDKDWGLSLMGSLGLAELNCRVVDVTSGEMLFSDRASGSQIRPGFGVRTEDFNLEDEHSIDESVLGISLRKAANKIAAQIVDAVDVIPWYGKVIKVEGDQVYITPGRSDGVRIGTHLQVIPGWQETDSESVEDTVSIGEIEIIGYVGERVSTAQVLSGDGIVVGSLVKVRK